MQRRRRMPSRASHSFRRSKLAKDRTGQEPLKSLCIFVFHHGTIDSLHQRHRRLNLLIRSAPGRVTIPAPVGLADHIADASLKDRIAVMAKSAGPHRCIKLDNREAEALGRGPEIHGSVQTLLTQLLGHLTDCHGSYSMLTV